MSLLNKMFLKRGKGNDNDTNEEENKEKASKKERLYQVQYYIGEEDEKKQGKGYGIAPFNLGATQQEIKEIFSSKKMGDSRYFVNGVIVDVYEKESLFNYFPPSKNYSGGEVGIRFIGDETSKKNFSDLASRLYLPFSEEGIIPYNGD